MKHIIEFLKLIVGFTLFIPVGILIIISTIVNYLLSNLYSILTWLLSSMIINKE